MYEQRVSITGDRFQEGHRHPVRIFEPFIEFITIDRALEIPSCNLQRRVIAKYLSMELGQSIIESYAGTGILMM